MIDVLEEILSNKNILATLESRIDAFEEIEINSQANDYTLAAIDNGKLIDMTKVTAKNLNIPLNATIPIDIGFSCLIKQSGAGQITFVPEGATTIESEDGALKTRVENSIVCAMKLGINRWSLTGGLTI